jgi:hypothetical protein
MGCRKESVDANGSCRVRHQPLEGATGTLPVNGYVAGCISHIAHPTNLEAVWWGPMPMSHNVHKQDTVLQDREWDGDNNKLRNGQSKRRSVQCCHDVAIPTSH